ncbi:hypothetical protein [Streptomyces sp. NRRL S-1813]|uniref:hypothetical protein n=1 Tax=Streptomyces sp. NRRL S-1813 TaxID=1463888 RepID=UPI001F30B7C8|nr:hypothetical protein [Streptomyces sp. NRRL S-1813]
MTQAAQSCHGDTGPRAHAESPQRLPDGDPRTEQRCGGRRVQSRGQRIGEPVAYDVLAGEGPQGVYDEYLRRPDLIRLATWARLERRPAGHLVDDPDRLDDGKLRAISEAQAAGLVRKGDPFDLMAMVIAMSMAWSPVSNVYAATAEEPDALHDRRRALLRESVHRAMTAA